MKSRAADQQIVTFKDGTTISADAVRLGLDLERRGVSFWTTPAGLAVRPASLLSDHDRKQIRAHKHALMFIANYDADAPATPNSVTASRMTHPAAAAMPSGARVPRTRIANNAGRMRASGGSE